MKLKEVLLIHALHNKCQVVNGARSYCYNCAQEQLNLHVRQCERQLSVCALKGGVVGSDVFGECKILVKSDIIDVGFPKRQSYALFLDGRQTCKVNVRCLKCGVKECESSL